MSDKDMLASMLLELSKQMACSNKSFHFKLKTKDIFFTFTSKDRYIPLPTEKKMKKKSSSQKLRFPTEGHFLGKKI